MLASAHEYSIRTLSVAFALIQFRASALIFHNFRRLPSVISVIKHRRHHRVARLPSMLWRTLQITWSL